MLTIARVRSWTLAVIGATCSLVLIDEAVGGGLRPWIVVEDGPVENLSALVYLAAFIVVVFQWRRYVRGPAAPVSLGIGGLALLGFLDEVSLGQRILGWTPPVVGEKPIDGVHDFIDVAYGFVRDYPAAAQIAIGAGLVLLLCGLLATIGRRGLVCASAATRAMPLLSLAVALLGIAAFLDLDLAAPDGPLAFVYPLEELLELSGGWAVLGAALVRSIEIRGHET